MASVSVASTVGAAANFKNLLMLNRSRATARVHSSMRHFNHRIHPPRFLFWRRGVFPRTQAGAPLCDFLLVGDVNGCGTYARPAREALSFGRVDYVIRGAHAYRGVHACVTGRSYRRYLNESL